MSNITRRTFGVAAAAGAALAGAALPQAALAEVAAHAGERRFPEGFLWGCATAAYQIEGAAAEDGRGPSLWDVFSHLPGKTHNGDTGDVADDSYHRYREDVQLLKALGVKGYRMSFSWSRIFPEGRGRVNQAGVDYYNRVVDELLAHGIQPYVTLFHWDTPAGLAGGWQSRETSKAFADYAAFVGTHFSDRVRHFMTTNEFTCFTDSGYSEGRFPPGLKLPLAEVNQVRHNAILAHGLGVQALRAHARPGTQVGLAENAQVFVPIIETAEHIHAAQLATRAENGGFLTALMEGAYPESYLRTMGAAAPRVEPGDMAAIGSRLDFVGLNIYTPNYVEAASNREGYRILSMSSDYPRMASDWLKIGPECIYWGIRNVSELWRPAGLYVTENGCSASDVPDEQGQVNDLARVMYLRNHLTHLQRAASEGYPIKGYFLWSLLDNYEWADGYAKRFGIHYVDFKTLKRTAKLSAHWYRELIARNAVV